MDKLCRDFYIASDCSCDDQFYGQKLLKADQGEACIATQRPHYRTGNHQREMFKSHSVVNGPDRSESSDDFNAKEQALLEEMAENLEIISDKDVTQEEYTEDEYSSQPADGTDDDIQEEFDSD